MTKMIERVHMKTSMKSILLSTLLLATAAFDVQAAPFARVTMKTPTATVMEFGNDQGLFASNLMSADILLNGGSIMTHVLGAALHVSVPVAGPAVRWEIPDANTVRIIVQNVSFASYALGVKICDYAGECADNSQMLLRYPSAPGFATNGFQAGTITPLPLNQWYVMASRIDYGATSGWGGTIFPVTVAAPTVITGFEALATSAQFSSPPFPHLNRAYVNVYSALSMATSNLNGDLVDLAPAAIEQKELYVSDPRIQRVAGSGLAIALQPGTYWFSVLYESPLGYPLETPASLESIIDLGTAYQIGGNPGATAYSTGFPGFTTGTPAIDLVGY